ncbi:methyltransferase domain-containing protein [uncultured Cohaesibacter sp.]|uniref:methyltransferase domain-containing protein n=1 Tax=uncultured Cohaesibacter sp. TaxID=1002546 RepID=UPI0029C6AC2F|nr:methyltransferase domain-containing protein [uncultured Cohaesibacter sp.]
MSGFDKDWLTLREPADMAARARDLVEELRLHLETIPVAKILDMGCGTGSTWRTLSARLPQETRWLLLDYDPLLLEEAAGRIGANDKVSYLQFDLSHLGRLPLDGVSLVTASAFFDLASEDFCAGFVERLASVSGGLYAALNYDGLVRWSEWHPLDEAVVAAFNRHQQIDKGLGPALGPVATACLEAALGQHGYKVQLMASPWRMDASMSELQQAFLSGFRQPVLEMGDLGEAEVEDWLNWRLAAIHNPDSLCEVGHTDLLALPQ